MKKIICGLFLFLITIALAFSYKWEGQSPKHTDESSPYGKNDIHISIEYNDFFKLSYRPLYGIAEWTMYDVDYDQLVSNNIDKSLNTYFSDSDSILRVSPQVYDNSGYIKGELVPEGHMLWNENARRFTHYMTNIVPQTEFFSNGIWYNLEKQLKVWTMTYGRTWVITGALINNPREYYARLNNKVIVPEFFWKIYFAYNYKGEPVAQAYLIPHSATNEPISKYIVSIRYIEMLTKLDFFSELNDKEEDTLETTQKVVFP